MRLSNLVIASVMILACGQCVVLANPVGIHVPSAFRDAIDGVIAGAPAGSDTMFVQLLGGDNARFIEDDIWQSLEAKFDRLAPLIVEAQSPPYVIDVRILEWYWEHADVLQRGEMLDGLRSWLTADLSSSPRFTVWGGTADLREDWSRWLARINAAEFLVDYNDQDALPLIDSLRNSLVAGFGGFDAMPGEWIEPWWYLHEASLRLRHPEQAVLCLPSESGGLQLMARPEDITMARYVPFFVDTHPEMPVGHATAARVLHLVQQASLTDRCREHGRAPCTRHHEGLMIQMSDGRELTVSYDADGVIICSDNTRYFRWAYKVVEPQLLSLLNEIDAAFTAERDGYPADIEAGHTGMPN